MEQLNSVSLMLQVNPDSGTFSIQARDPRFPRLENIQLGCEYTFAGKQQRCGQDGWQVNGLAHHLERAQAHGEMDCLTVALEPDANKVSLRLSFALMREYPLVLWKIQVTNHGKEDVEINRITLLRVVDNTHYLKVRRPDDLGFFSNGWQSWSPSRWYSGNQRMTISRLYALQRPMIYNPGTPTPVKKGVFSSDMFAVVGDRATRAGYLLGFLSQLNHFGSILADFNTGEISMWANGDGACLEAGKSMQTDWAVFTPVLLDHRAPLETYIEAVGRENHARVPAQTPVGWCSWYHFYTSVTARNIIENLDTILERQEELPIELVQIDDGFEKQVGDWLEFRSTFPEGVAPLAASISGGGLLPGLWLAPFIVHPGADLLHKHPDWMLRKANGRLVNAGLGWNALTTALDLTKPPALQYAAEVVHTAVQKWGFPYLKLDFLYAAALKGHYYDRSKTRAQVMRMGMEALRQAAGEQTTLLGCGAPLGSVIGVVDTMRIGPDVSEEWLPVFKGVQIGLRREPSMPSTRNSIHNILTRANLNRRWWVNDPDCLLVRADTSLMQEEVRSLATVIALTGGSLLLSDDLPGVPPERIRLAEALIPVMGEEVRVLDWFDNATPSRLRVDMDNETGGWHLLGGFNWSEQTADVMISASEYGLEEGEYLFREFWSGKTGMISGTGGHVFPGIPPHASVLLAVRRFVGEKALYLGSDLHFTQGAEVAEWLEKDGSLEMTLRLPRTAIGQVFFHLPGKPQAAFVDGKPVYLHPMEQGIYRLPVVVEGFCNVRIMR